MTGARAWTAMVPFVVWAVLAAAPVALPTVAILAVGWWAGWLAAHSRRPAVARFCTIGAVAATAGLMWIAAQWVTVPPWWLLPMLLAIPAVAWWHATFTFLPGPNRDDGAGEDEEPRRSLTVREAGESGVDVGGIDTVFDYPDEDHAPRTPPPGWEPRAMVTGGAPIAGVFTDEDTDGPDDVGGSLPERLLAAWPTKPDGAPYRNVHAVDLAALVGVSQADLEAELDAAGITLGKVTASPLDPDPATGRKLPATGRKGLSHAALSEAVRAMPRAMP